MHRRSRTTIKVKCLFLNYQTNRLLLSKFGLKETVRVKIHACKMPLLNPSFLHAWIFTHMVFPFYTADLEETIAQFVLWYKKAEEKSILSLKCFLSSFLVIKTVFYWSNKIVPYYSAIRCGFLWNTQAIFYSRRENWNWIGRY